MPTSSTTAWPGDDVELLDMEVDGKHQIKTVLATADKPEWASHWDESVEETPTGSATTLATSTTTTTSASESIDYSAYVTLIPWELIQQNGKSEKLQEMREALLSQQRQEEGRVQQQQAIYRDERVRVVIHNITQISESDVQKWNNSSGNDVDGSDAYVNLKL